MTLTIPSLLYFAAVTLLFFNIREALKTRFLAVASIFYVFLLSRRAGTAVLAVSVLAWAAGRLIGWLGRRGLRKTAQAAAGICIAAAVLSLAVFKYAPVLPASGSSMVLSKLIMPVGYSFYIFQVISYLADVCAGRTDPFAGWFDVLLFLCWFPKFVSGPIERKEEFGPRIEAAGKARFLDPERWGRVIGYVLTGCFYKMVIADRVGQYVDCIFEYYEGFSSVWLLIGVLLYTVQIYCDFAGYSFAAIGISAAFDIPLTQNFLSPYCSANITEFWRRWHRSLSSWLRDYLYIPLGGNRRGKGRKILNTLIVFLVCGMWHGAGTGFLIWGLLHGIYSALDGVFRNRKMEWIRKGIPGRALTFLSVSFAWIFFRASSAQSAFLYLKAMLTVGPRWHSFDAERAAAGLDKAEIIVIIVSLVVMLIMDMAAYRKDCPVPEILKGKHYLIRYAAVFVLAMVIIVFGMYGPAYDSSRMIYMQF